MTPESRSSGARVSIHRLGNGSVNRFPRQRRSRQQSRYYWAITMETVFSVGSAPSYITSIRGQLRKFLRDSWDGSRRWLWKGGNKFMRLESQPVKRRLTVWFEDFMCSYSESYKSVCQDTTSKDWEPLCVTLKYKVCTSAIALYYLLRVECISAINSVQPPSVCSGSAVAKVHV
jgi:hypothetical protein